MKQKIIEVLASYGSEVSYKCWVLYDVDIEEIADSIVKELMGD